MNHYIITAYEDMAKERFAELQKEAAIRRRVKEAQQALPKKPGLVARLRASSITVSRTVRAFFWQPRGNSLRRHYAKRTI
jgi:hypothetical protein